MNHEEVTAVMTANGTIPYGVGIRPNPYAARQVEWVRRNKNAAIRKLLTDKIESIFEIRFISSPETAECIESIVTMTDARRVLELGTCTGFTSLHIMRALAGKEGACFVSIDPRIAHDKEFWADPALESWVHHVEGWTPQVLATPAITQYAPYDLVFVDSQHTLEHTRQEVDALWPITRKGSIFLFHDLPEWQGPTVHAPHPTRVFLLSDGRFKGVVLPSGNNDPDAIDAWGVNYPVECGPHLGIFQRT